RTTPPVPFCQSSMWRACPCPHKTLRCPSLCVTGGLSSAERFICKERKENTIKYTCCSKHNVNTLALPPTMHTKLESTPFAIHLRTLVLPCDSRLWLHADSVQGENEGRRWEQSRPQM
ncbi:unnamed protein product, partial [Ectocarpus sp. 12 AP-2014]